MIDLTKLKALELPTKEIEVEIMGEKQTLKIVCPSERTQSAIAGIAANNIDSPELSSKILDKLLEAGAPELSAEDRELLLDRSYKTAGEIAEQIRKLITEFAESRKKLISEVKKNSKTPTADCGKSC